MKNMVRPSPLIFKVKVIVKLHFVDLQGHGHDFRWLYHVNSKNYQNFECFKFLCNSTDFTRKGKY